ncbi:MAG TPA: hypothetical protein VKR56_03490 [Candidatus Cybelea sp.]|nr:hypothetical protein [Candidatus Cybelea sp.]
MHAVLLSLVTLIGTAASPAPSPAPTPNAPSDPCGSILSIVTRPTVTTSVCTVRRHNVLLESGYTNTQTTGAGGGSTVAYPQAYLRFGTSDPHLEFDVTPPSANASSVGNAAAGGTSDVGLGAKYELGYGARWLYGVNAAVTYPTGSRAFSAGAAQYIGNLNWSYTVNQVIGLSGTVGFNSLSGLSSANSPQSYFAFIPSVVASASLPGPSEFYVEYTYFSQAGVGLGGKSLIDSAFLRDFGNRVQLDIEYGFSPTLLGGQRQHYLGGGASIMF